jgi:hypothetical protein
MSKATSLSIVARKELNADQQAELSVANKPLLQQYGFPEDLGQNLPQVISAAKSMLEGLGVSGITWPENPTPDDLLELSEQLKNLLGPALVAQLEEEGRIQDSLTRMEDRPFHVAVGSVTAKAKKRLSNTLRDAEHIMLFVINNSEIDLLQVDRAQEEIIRRDKPRHRLSELGLADRCFSADSLTDVVETVREIIRDLRISADS